MVVFWLALGTATKLAFAVAVTYRTPLWWLPGATSIALGSAAAMMPAPLQDAGRVAIVLGMIAILLARACAITHATSSQRRSAVAARTRRVSKT